MEKTTLVIADSHEIVREGIGMRLSEACDINIVAETSDGYGTLKTCRQLKPEVLVMDFALQRPTGMETLCKIRSSCPDTKIIVLSSESSVSDAFYVLSKGAMAFLPKQSRGASFVQAVQAALNGFSYIPIELLREFVKSRKNLTRTGNIFGLSAREIEILESTLTGLSAKEVAVKLEISVRTVETHKNRIYKKTDCRDHDELRQIIGL